METSRVQPPPVYCQKKKKSAFVSGPAACYSFSVFFSLFIYYRDWAVVRIHSGAVRD